MQSERQEELRERLDEALLAFRLARKTGEEAEGWLRVVRQAVGIPVDEVARRLGVSRREIHRMEIAENESRIQLGTLRTAAAALECELVYALTPRRGTLKDLAELQRVAQENAREAKLERTAKILERVGWRTAMLKSLRRALRKAGMKVR